MMVRGQPPQAWFGQWFKQNAIVISFLAGQLGAGIWWARGIDVRVDNLENGQHEQDRTIARIDERGSRAIPTIEQRIAQHENAFLQEQRQIDDLRSRVEKIPAMNAEIVNLKDQALRIIQALDNTYNLLNEHMRRDGDARTNSPPPLNLVPKK